MTVAGPRTRVPLASLAAAACVAAPPLVLVGAPPWARFPAVLLVLALAPGTALLRLMQPPDQKTEIVLAAGVSVGVTAIAAQAMLWAGAFHPKLLVCLLSGLCLACLASVRLGLPGIPRLARDAAARLWSAARRSELLRRRERATGLAPVSEPPGAPDREPNAHVASVLVRAHGDPAALALALNALLAREASAAGRDAARADGELRAQDAPLVLRPAPRRFSAEYKLQILREAEACTRKGEIAALLRREGLCTSQLTAWRRKREEGALAALDREPEGTRAFGLAGEQLGPGAARGAGR